MIINWKKLFVVFVILLFVGVVFLIGLGNMEKIAILWKTP